MERDDGGMYVQGRTHIMEGCGGVEVVGGVKMGEVVFRVGGCDGVVIFGMCEGGLSGVVVLVVVVVWFVNCSRLLLLSEDWSKRRMDGIGDWWNVVVEIVVVVSDVVDSVAGVVLSDKFPSKRHWL